MTSSNTGVLTHQLTKFPQGSMRELWTISMPLMISLLSGSLMLFLDRLLLAQASIECHNACTNAGIFAAAVQFPFLSTVGIAEVFVGQYNGAGLKQKLGEPVWQMIWLSLFTGLVFIPLGIFGGQFFFTHPSLSALERLYFGWIMLFAPFFCLASALTTFYIGQGQVKFITAVVILANLVNVGLDLVLIFGVSPWLPPFGIAGAAIATGCAQLFQCIVLFVAFMRKKNRKQHGTGDWTFKSESFLKCVKVGCPNACAHGIEVLGWSVFFQLMTSLGHEYITVVAVAQSIFFLFTFITEGISKGASAIAANLIGAKQWHMVWKLLRSGLIIYVQVFLLLGFVLILYPDPLIHWFLPHHSESTSAEIVPLIRAACVWIWIFFLFDGITWLVVGLLTAAGDTRFVLKVGGTTVWVFALLPIYIFVVHLGHKADVAWMITAGYGIANATIYLLRFYSERWKNISIT